MPRKSVLDFKILKEKSTQARTASLFDTVIKATFLRMKFIPENLPFVVLYLSSNLGQ